MVGLAVIIKRRMWNIRGTAEGEGGGGEAHQNEVRCRHFVPRRRIGGAGSSRQNAVFFNSLASASGCVLFVA